MRSTMMDFPLTVGHIFEHGRALYADSEVVTSEAGGVRRIGFGALADRADQLAAALRRLGVEPGDRVATFGWNNSGAPGGVFRHSRHGRGDAHPQHPAGGGADPLHHRPRRGPRADRRRQPGASPRTGPGGRRGRAQDAPSSDRVRRGRPVRAARAHRLRGAARRGAAGVRRGRRSTRRRPPRCATPAAPPTCPRESSTAIGRRSCTRWASAPARPSGSASTTACCRSCPCSTATPGGCRTPPGWSAPTCCCRTGSRRPSRWPGSLRRSGPPWPRPCRPFGMTSSAWTRRASISPRCA